MFNDQRTEFARMSMDRGLHVALIGVSPTCLEVYRVFLQSDQGRRAWFNNPICIVRPRQWLHRRNKKSTTGSKSDHRSGLCDPFVAAVARDSLGRAWIGEYTDNAVKPVRIKVAK